MSMSLSDYIDQEVIMLIPHIDPIRLQRVKLRGVEPGGVWIESQTYMNSGEAKAKI